jgi:hypothetical protein
MRKVFAQVADGALVERVAMMGTVQDAFHTVELHADARAGERLDVGTEVTEQRFHFPPVDVAADGVVKDRLEQVLVLVAHQDRLLGGGGADDELTEAPARRDAG